MNENSPPSTWKNTGSMGQLVTRGPSSQLTLASKNNSQNWLCKYLPGFVNRLRLRLRLNLFVNRRGTANYGQTTAAV